MISPFDATNYEFKEYVSARNWIGGEFREASGTQTMEILNPRWGKPMASVRFSTAADVDAAAKVAKAAWADWKLWPMRERAHILYKLRELVLANAKDLAWLCSHENGKTFEESMAEVDKTVECLEFGCGLPNMAGGQELEVSRGVTCRQVYEPIGVCAGVTPFNFPLMVPFWMLPQALVAGNTFLLKPSERVPLTMQRMTALFEEAGLPRGVLNVVNGGRETVEALCDHPDIKALAFVGSTRVAKMVYGRASMAGKRALCLGGAKNHLIVVPDADVELTADNVVASYTGCAGQRCMAASVMVAVGDVDHIISAVAERSKKMVPGTTLGAITSRAAVERIEGYIADAEKRGARVLVDGRGQKGSDTGFWVGPTLLDGVSPDMPAGCEEIFGPVLSIVRVKDLDEAIALENSNPYGNAAAVYTTSGDVAKRVIERTEAGMCGVNIGVPVPREPFGFGGWNDSLFGAGNITGWDGFRFWTRPRKVTTKWALQKDQTWMS